MRNATAVGVSKWLLLPSPFNFAFNIAALLALSFTACDGAAVANAVAQINGPGLSIGVSEVHPFSWKSDNGGLTIESTAKIAVAVKDDRKTEQRLGRSANLLHGDWRGKEIGGKAVVVSSEVSLTFEPDGRIYGNASCNRFFGSFRLIKGRLKISETGASMMACDPPLMDQERNFLNALEAVDHFAVTSTGQLRLLGADGRVVIGLQRQ